MAEIDAKFLREIVRWNSETAVISAELRSGGRISVIVDAEDEELEPGLRYRFSGDFTFNPKYGQQFRAKYFVLDMPLTEDAIVEYLQRFPGIGPKTARSIFTAYGAEALEKLAEAPQLLTRHGSFKDERLAEIGAQITADLTESKMQLELATYLAGYRLPKDLYKALYRKYGVSSVKILKRNPYILLGYERCGFTLVDAFAIAKGYNPDRLKRQALVVLEYLKSKGDTWILCEDALGNLKMKLHQSGYSNVRFRDALKLLIRAKMIRGRDDSGQKVIALEEDARDEEVIADEVKRRLVKKAPIEMDLDGLSESQKEAIQKAVRFKIGCLTGGPGTGKTFSTARYIQALLNADGEDSVTVLAPTGKAVVRIREALQSLDVDVSTKTIHSLLCSLEKGFQVEYKHIVVDESSMIDASLMRRLLTANPTSTFLFVGDDGQLMPVGKGRPFADILASGTVPVGRLTEVRRNAGAIVEACHAIRDGGTWSPDPKTNLKILPTSDPLTAIGGLIQDLAPTRDVSREMQVICGLNRGDFGITNLNPFLRKLLNPGADPDRKFSPGDPVICLKNDLYLDGSAEWKDIEREAGSVYISNGEIGHVTQERKGMIIADFGLNRVIRFRPSNIQFALGYAVTCHKMQGSETPIAVIILDPTFGAGMVCTREWLYTAISRAKEECYLIGDFETALKFCRKLGAKRRTHLIQLLSAGTDSDV